jgi:hypothetical protein
MEKLTKKLTNPQNEAKAALTRQPNSLEPTPRPINSPNEASQPYFKILDLVETGQGVDIPGVFGTAYGYVQAVVEYVDHYKEVKPRNRSENEARFESAIFGQGAKLKAQAIDLALKAA